MNTCLFCDITTGAAPSTKVYEDEYSYAFLDIHPHNPGHTLLIPKDHSRNIFDISEETLCHLAKPLKKLAQAIKDATSAMGINIVMNNEKEAGQIIFHSHIQIIPRFAIDDTRRHTYQDGEVEMIAEKIRQELV